MDKNGLLSVFKAYFDVVEGSGRNFKIFRARNALFQPKTSKTAFIA